MASLEQFTQQTFAEETKLITDSAVEWQDPPEIRLERVQSDGFLVIRDPHRLEHLAAPWPEARAHGEVMIELKMPGNHLDREQVERALLRRQARQVQRVAGHDAAWLGEEPLWLVAPHLPAWLHEMRRPACATSGCYWIEPQWQRFLWIAANELPLREELIPFLLARSGQPLDEFATWVEARRPPGWMLNMLEYLPMSPETQKDLLLRVSTLNNPQLEAQRWRLVLGILETNPQFKEELLREGREEGREEGMRAALRRVLARRKLPISDRDDARIQSCTDYTTLERWLDQAVVAGSVAEALE